MPARKAWTLALAGAMCITGFPAVAGELTLDAAIRRTLEHNPALRAEGSGLDALLSQAHLDGLAPPLTFGTEVENFGGTGDLSGVHGAETTLRLGRVIELGSKRDARVARGLADVERQRNVIRQRELDLAAEATRRYIAVSLAQQERALARQQHALATETEAAVRQRVERGAAPEADRLIADIAVARAEIAREHAEHERASARFALGAMWGEPAEPEIEATGDLLTLPDLPVFDTLAARLAGTPEADAFARDADRLDADRVVATASGRPDMALSLGVRRLEAIDDQGLVFSLAVPLGTGERAAHAVARNEAERAALDARRDAALLEARQRLFARFQELRHARTEYDALTIRMIPTAERGLTLTRAGYDSARYSILQLVQAQATLLQLQQERLAAAARYHTLLAEIERSTAAAGEIP